MTQLRLLAIPLLLAGCYHSYTPPATPLPIQVANSEWDDYNAAYPYFRYGTFVFSTNRGSQGKDFDVWHLDLEFEDYGARALKGPEPFHPEWMSPGNEFGPLLNPEGEGLMEVVPGGESERRRLDAFVFASDRAGGKGGLDLYRAKSGDTEPKNLEALNSPANDAYWTRAAGSAAYFASDRGERGYDIYEIQGPDDFKVREVVELSSEKDDTAPYVFWYEKQLYMVFASNRSGGAGGWDLWCSRLAGARWDEPRPLQFANTSSDEFRPSVATGWGAYTLVFSSNRPGGRGGFDLYFARFQSPF